MKSTDEIACGLGAAHLRSGATRPVAVEAALSAGEPAKPPRRLRGGGGGRWPTPPAASSSRAWANRAMIARKIAATLASTGRRPTFVHPAEASHGDLGMVENGDVVLAISWSGETAELAAIITYAKRYRIPLIAITTDARKRAWTRGRHSPRFCRRRRRPARTASRRPPRPRCNWCSATRWRSPCSEAKGFTARDFSVFHPGGKLGARLDSGARRHAPGRAHPARSVGARHVGGGGRDLRQGLWLRRGVRPIAAAGRHHHRRRPAPAHEIRSDGHAGDRGDDQRRRAPSRRTRWSPRRSK